MSEEELLSVCKLASWDSWEINDYTETAKWKFTEHAVGLTGRSEIGNFSAQKSGARTAVISSLGSSGGVGLGYH